MTIADARCVTLTLTVLVAGCARSSLRFERRELTIPMRDQVILHAVALIPQGDTTPVPILLIRTPFGANTEFPDANLPAQYRELARDGYIFVTEDIRGRGMSDGTFESLRPPHDAHDSAGIDESTDAWDTIDWLVKNLPHNNGKVAVLGISYRGWLAGVAGIHPHPALKAISPQAPVADTWLGDDFFHHGAFRETQAVAYAAYVELGHAPRIPDGDQYDFYLRAATLDSIAKLTGVADAPSWIAFSAHPGYDDWWRQHALATALTHPAVPTLWVGGFWDQEDLRGAQAMYGALEAHDSARWNRVALGPWFHGGWTAPRGDSIGAIPLGGATAQFFRDSIQRPWLAYYLHGRGDGHFPEAWVFETGENAWHTMTEWPPASAVAHDLYLGPDGKLLFRAPRAGAQFDRFVSDPANPVPYVPRPDTENGWATWLVEDQRFAQARPDVLTWISAPLTTDFTIAGDVTAHLFASTTGTDADWVVKLIDVYPDTFPADTALHGYELMVAGDILRGRYWRAFTRPEPLTPNAVTPFTVDLHQQLYRFRAGHRVMVQVQSSWFPLYDRNPQQFMPNIFDARPGDFRAEEHRVWHTAQFPSRVTVRELR